MKQLLLAMTLAWCMSTNTWGFISSNPATASDNDTTVINNAQKVVIITGDSLQKIKISGKEGNDNFTYENTIQLVDSNYVSSVTINKDWNISIGVGKKDCDDHWTNTITSHLGFGMTAPTKVSKGISFSTGSSWEIFWTILQWNYTPKPKKNNFGHGYSIGLGIDWRNYRMTGGEMFIKDEADKVAVVPYPEGTNPKFSRIKVFSINVPMLFTQDFNKRGNFSLSLGPIVNFNTYASIKTRYKQDGGDFKKVTKGINQRPITVDFMAIVRNPILDFYVKYSPMDVLKSDRGPKFRSLSFGLYL